MKGIRRFDPKDKRGQLNIGTVVGILIAAITLIVGALVISPISQTGQDIVTDTNVNRTIINENLGASNSTTILANTPIVAASETIVHDQNGTAANVTLTRDTDYTIDNRYGTVIITSSSVNGSGDENYINYTAVNRTTAFASIDTVGSNTFSGFDIVSVGIIVLAAAAVIGVIMILGRR
jgi:hypothetical protein